MTSAAIYARVSSARQAKDETIGSQLAALREHAATSRLDVPEDWVFADEGHSGATLVRPGLEALRDLAAQGCLDVVLVYSPDRLARKFAYQALLIEELARCGVRVEFVKGPRGDSPEDQLLVQFQGMFAEYEKAQLAERYRRGKAWRAKTGSVNVLSGAPFGYRYVRKTPVSGARYEVVPHEAVLVSEMFRRYADDGAAIADLRRWLTDQGVRTRTGKERWDRSVIWGMLRNPAYAGTAVFGKTQAVHEAAGLNRTARLAGRTVPRQVRTEDRPREEWTAIPVPALVDQDTFDRVQQRLEDNKRFAARNTKVPSLLQGLAACASCGYGYYRTSATTSSGKKIYYYRCLGSDDYRYQGGRVCGNKPVRADYVDAVVWDHVTGLLADPALIRTEISRRLERARTSDPVSKKRGQLEQALAKTSKSIAAMVTAFSEQLITIDELRARMPDLRARETGLKDQIAALDAQAADRDAYLKLADDLQGFLGKLRANSATATTEDRQRVLRAVVQDVLVGPEKLTIRHRIPVREPSSSGGHHNTTDTEGDMRESSLLRWGREDAALGRAGDGVPDLTSGGHDSRLQERPDQGQDALVPDPPPHPLKNRGMRQLIEARLDVPLEDPGIAPGPEVVDLGDRVLGTAARTEAVADRLEVRLEHRLQHQQKGSLDQPVHRGRYAQPPVLSPPAGLGDHSLPHRQGGERPGPELLAGFRQERHDVGRVGDERRDDPVHPRSAAALVAPHPVPGHHQEGRVADEVEQIIKPAGGIVSRPSVQLGLHPLYPLPGRQNVRPGRLTSIHQRLQSLPCLACANPLGPFAMRTAFPSPDYYGPSAPPAAVSRRRAAPPARPPDAAAQTGTAGGSHVHRKTDRQARQPALPLRPRHGYAAGLHRGLPPGDINPGQEFPARNEERVRAAIQPISAGFELADTLLRSFRTLVPLVCLPASLARPAPSGSTGTPCRCRGCFPPSPAPPGSDCPQLHPAAATARRRRSPTSTRFHSASWRTKSQIQALDRTAPCLPLLPTIPARMTHDYVRHGTSSLFAALDLASGSVIAEPYRRHRHQEFLRFLKLIDTAVPKDLELHLVLDNYATCKTPAIHQWLLKHPRFHLHFTPTSSSWMNLVER